MKETKTTIEQRIFDLIEVSKVSKVPILMVSNPGYGKTTIINKYAKMNNLHVETLIGSRFTPSDIMGYQVNNGGTHLEHLNPTWYERIMEAHNNNQASILFIDELSTCTDEVQGSLLDLIFSRTTGDNRKLPNDCFIISAANYARNLPNFMNIMAPTLNRFCVINLLSGMTNLDIMNEFIMNRSLKEPASAAIHAPRSLTEETKNNIESEYFETMKKIMVKYSGIDNSIGVIDLQNQDFEGIYQADGDLLGFMSGRTMFYLKQMTMALVACGISYKSDLVKMITDGLCGCGSNSFKSDEQTKAFRELLATSIGNIIRKASGIVKNTDINIDFSKTSIADAVVKAMAEEEDKTSLDNNLTNEVCNEIIKRYEDTLKVYEDLENEKIAKMQFISDMESISTFIKIVKDEDLARVICGIHQSLLGAYNDLLGTNSTINDYKSVYSLFTPKSVKGIVVLKLKDGTLTKAGYVGSGSSKTYTRMTPTQNPVKTTLSKIILGSSIDKEIHITKVM